MSKLYTVVCFYDNCLLKISYQESTLVELNKINFGIDKIKVINLLILKNS